MKNILITGAAGFIGRNTSLRFKNNNFRVIGIGNGNFTPGETAIFGIDKWVKARVHSENLEKINEDICGVIHCAGSGSVGTSFLEPFIDYEKNVSTTVSVLEYIRKFNPSAKLIHLSSAAVYGVKKDKPLNEDEQPNPVSPYGYHKLISEKICESYSKNFNINVSIIRLFSVYGNGLKKQLLWDACKKFTREKELVFFGTGMETRDWIHIDDVTNLIFKVFCHENATGFNIFNGGSGNRITNHELLTMLASFFPEKKTFCFNNVSKEGDPKYYRAELKRITDLGWIPMVSLSETIERYVQWFIETDNE